MNHSRSPLLFLTCLVLGLDARAANVAKENNTTALNLPGSWVGGALPGGTDVAVWDTPFAQSGQITFGALNQSWAGIKVLAPTVAPSIRSSSGYSLTLGGSGIDMGSATQNFTIGQNVTAGADQAWNIASGRTLTLGNGLIGSGVTVTKSGSGSVVVAGSGTLVFAGGLVLNAGDFQFAPSAGVQSVTGVVSGAAALTKAGAGALVLSGSNSFAGGVTVSAGLLNLGNAGALGSGALTITGGGLDNSSGGPITLSGDPPLNWNGDFTFAGSSPLNLGSGAVTMSGNRILTTTAGVLTVKGAITGTGNLTKAGAGTLSIDSVGSSIGLMIVSGGTLKIAGGDFTCAGGGSALDIGRGGNGAIEISGGLLTVNGTQYGLVMGESGTAGWTQTGGTVNIAAPSGIFTGNQVGGNSTMTLSGGSFTQSTGAQFIIGCRSNTSLTVSGAAEFNVFALQFGHPSTAGGTSVVDLDGGNISAASVTRASGSATFNFNGGVLRASSGSSTFMTGLTAAYVRSGGARVDPNGYFVNVAQPLLHDPFLGSTADGGLVVNDSYSGGTLTLAGACTYTGPTLVQAGTLAIGPGGSIAGSPLVELGPNGIFDALTGASVPTGQTLQGTGTVMGALTIAPGGRLSPAGTNLGTMTALDSLTLNGTAEFQINKTGSTRTSDLVTGALRITYGGTLNVTSTGAALALGDSFKLFDSLAYSGGFTVFNLPALTAGLYWETSTLAVDGTLKVINTLPTPLFNPGTGGYLGAQSVTITGVADSTIHYTTDGSDPLSSPTKTSGPSPLTGIVVPAGSSNFKIRAYVSKTGATSSPVAEAVYQIVDAGIWIFDSSGNWQDTSKWLYGVVPQGVGITADFSTQVLVGNSMVTLDSSRVIGNLKFADIDGLYNWTLAPAGGSSLTLDAGVNKPVIHVGNTTTTITTSFVGSNGYVKTGAGSLVTSLANASLAGGVVVREGDLRIDKVNSAGTGAITLGDAQSGAAEIRLLQRGSDPWPPTDAFCTNPINVAAGPTGRVVVGRSNSGNYAGILQGVITLNNNVVLRNDGGDRLAVEGKITGTGNVTFEGVRVNVDNVTNDFVGNVTIASGCLLQINGNGVIPATADITSDGILGFNTGSATALTFGGLNGTGVVSVPYGGGAASITIGSQNRSGAFSGVIQNNISVVKTGTGMQSLSGASVHAGTTTINGGTLLVNNPTGSGTGSGAVTANTGGTLGGSGAISGTVTVNSGATLAPGADGIGTLSVGAVTLAGTYQCQLGGAAADQLAVTGNLDLTGSALVVSTISPQVPGTYVIATFTGSRTGEFTSVTAGYTVDYGTPNQVKLVVSGSGDPYQSWVGGFGLTGNNALPTADPDLDGIANSVEFVLGGNPAGVQDQNLLPTITLVTNPGGTVPNGDYLRFTYRRVPASAYLNPGMQYDADLAGTWTSATGAPGVVEVVTPNAYTTPTPADKVDVYVPRAGNAVNGKLFGRLQVVNP